MGSKAGKPDTYHRPFIPSPDEEIEGYRLQDKQRVIERWRPEGESIEATIKDLSLRFDNQLGFTEVRDRVHIVNENLYSYVMEHPLVVQHAELYRQLWLAHERLAHVYQLVADVEEEVCGPAIEPECSTSPSSASPLPSSSESSDSAS
jgi:hypothetical protein